MQLRDCLEFSIPLRQRSKNVEERENEDIEEAVVKEGVNK